jgi:DNA-binding transcriptional LysR family regulator
VLAMLRSNEIDVGIVSLGDAAEEGLIIQPLIEDELKLLLAPEHPLAAYAQIEVEQLREETFLLHEVGSTSRTLSDEWASKVGMQWESVMELGAIETIKEALKCNMGIGILPRRSVIREVEAGELVICDLPHYINRRYICLAYRNEEQLSPHVRSFIEFVKHTFLS